jgi:zinc protease
MQDLTDASYEDVVSFFRTYYAPSNAVLTVAGDIDTADARTLVEKWFNDVGAGARVPPIAIPGVELSTVVRETITDRVQLPLLMLAWLTPRELAPGDAALRVVADVLTGGKNSRLYKRLVYEMQIAQSVFAYQDSQALSSQFIIQAMPRPGHGVEEIQKVIEEELAVLQAEGPSDRELERAVNKIEASFYRSMEQLGSYDGKASQLNEYFVRTGNPDWFNEDLGRFRVLSPSDIRAAARAFLPADRRVELTVIPEPAAPAGEGAAPPAQP